MRTLSKAEEQLMQILWNIGGGFLRDIVQEFPEPRPHQNTVATILKTLVEKGFVNIKVYGRNNQYLPAIRKGRYAQHQIKSLVRKYYDGSFTDIVSSMIKDKNLSIEELELLLNEFTDNKQNR